MRTLLQQLYRGLFGLQFRTTVLLTLVVLAATGLTGATYLRISSRLALTQTKKHARDMARSLAAAAAGAVERHDREALLAIAAGTVPGSELCYLLFTDMTGEILARAVDQRAANTPGNIMRMSSGAGNRAEVAKVFAGWADLLREGLDELRTTPVIPSE